MSFFFNSSKCSFLNRALTRIGNLCAVNRLQFCFRAGQHRLDGVVSVGGGQGLPVPGTVSPALTCRPSRWRRRMTGCATGTPGRRRGQSTCCPCTSTGEWSTALRACAGWTHRYHGRFLVGGGLSTGTLDSPCRVGSPWSFPVGPTSPHSVGTVQTPTVKPHSVV